MTYFLGNRGERMDSILNSTKKLLGIDQDYKAFDVDIITSINSALMVCMQLGVGPENGFMVTGEEQTWSDFLEDDLIQLQAVKQYVYLKTRQVFDPPESSSVANSIDNIAKEIEWRMNVQSTKG